LLEYRILVCLHGDIPTQSKRLQQEESKVCPKNIKKILTLNKRMTKSHVPTLPGCENSFEASEPTKKKKSFRETEILILHHMSKTQKFSLMTQEGSFLLVLETECKFF